MKVGLVVLGHGSRASVDEANEVTFQVTEILKQKVGHDLVETAIMNPESGRPGLPIAVAKLADRGVQKIIVLPMFLSNGMHIQKDIPEELAEINKHYPGLVIVQARHMGADPRIADILLERMQEVQ